MSTCPNCRTTLSCGCQIRTASNGARVCANCISSYEAALLQIQQAITPPVKKYNNT